MNFLTLWPNWVLTPLLPLARFGSCSKTTLKSLLLIALFTFLAVPQSLAKPEFDHRPLNQKLTFEEYEDLVKYFVSTIPEFQNLWEWQKRSGLPFYFAGGELRGLLTHIDGLLSRFPLNYVQEMRAPTIKSLQVLGGSDVDLFVPDGMEKAVAEAFTFFDGDYLDILEEKFYRHSLEIGGTSIGKIRVNPSEIQDPFNGLRAYYEGRLDFQWVSESDFKKAHLVYNDGVTRESEALRFIRLTYNLPHLQPDPLTVERIKNLANSETAKLEFDSYTTDHWIKKGLKKLYQSTRKDLVETLKALKDYNLLYALARKGFHVEVEQGLTPLVDRLRLLGFSEMDLIYAGSLVHTPIEDKVEFLSILSQKTQDPKVLLALFGTAKILLRHQKSVRLPLVNWMISIFPKFHSLKPNKLQSDAMATFYQALVDENYIKTGDQLRLLEANLSAADSVSSFVFAIEFARKTLDPLSFAQTEPIIRKHVNKYFSFNPNYLQFTEFFSNYVSGSTSKITFLSQAFHKFGSELKISDFPLTWYEKSVLGFLRSAAGLTSKSGAKNEVSEPGHLGQMGFFSKLGICPSALRKNTSQWDYR